MTEGMFGRCWLHTKPYSFALQLNTFIVTNAINIIIVSKRSLRHWQCNLLAFNRFDIHNCQWRLITEDERWLRGAFFTWTAIGGTNSQWYCTVYTNINVVRIIESNKHHGKLIKLIKVYLWINWFSYFKIAFPLIN